MSKIVARDRRVIELARRLGMPPYSGDPVAFVVTWCLRKVTQWVQEFGPRTLEEFLQTVTAKVGLIIEEMHDDGDLFGIRDNYLNDGEGGFSRLTNAFDDRTYAAVIRLRRPRNGCTYVAVIDCRAGKRSRRWFSIWHEIAHLLTNPQLAFDFRRTVVADKDPMESLMDAIAGQLAFFAPLYDLDDAAAAPLSIADLEAHRVQRSPQASRESAYSAIVSRLSRPALLIVAGLQLKANERRAMSMPALFPQESPMAKLRAMNVVISPGARDAGVFLPKNMRVPPDSIIAHVFSRETLDLVEQTWVAHEDLSMWESKGEHRPELPIVVEAGRCGSRVIALVTVRE